MQLSFFNDTESLLFPENLLEYHSKFLDKNESIVLMENLISTAPWQQPFIKMYDKHLLTPRLTAWFGDKNSSYKFSGTKFDPYPWTDELFDLKNKIADFTNVGFNSVLLNYYRDGNDSVAWHADDEKELGERPTIASLSLGEARQFDFRHKQNHQQKYGLKLENGSLLIMRGALQHDWEHRIPKSTKPMKARINLTFRTIK